MRPLVGYIARAVADAHGVTIEAAAEAARKNHALLDDFIAGTGAPKLLVLNQPRSKRSEVRAAPVCSVYGARRPPHDARRPHLVCALR